MRFLAIASAFFSLSIILANYCFDCTACWFLAAGLLVAGITCIKLKNRKIRIIAVLAAFSLSAGFAAYAVNYVNTVERANTVHGKNYSYNAEVLDYPYSGDNYERVCIKIQNTEAKGLKAFLYSYSEDLSVLEPGMHISFEAALESVGKEETDGIDSFLSSGVFLKGQFSSRIICLKPTLLDKVTAFPAISKNSLIKIIDKAFPKSSSPFFISLLTGDKNELYKSGSDYTKISRAGFSHVIAVSGMHVAFVVGLLQGIFGKRRFAAVLCIAGIWSFVALTGSSPSSVRACIMQTVLLMSFVLRRENDIITSLSFALALILLLNPFSAKSVSLQLSFGAVLGICLFGQKINNTFLAPFKNNTIRKIFEYPIGILANSLAVQVFTIPVAAIRFGFISIVSPLTNILALWAVPVCFIGAFIACFLYLLFPAAGMLAGKLFTLFSEYILHICGHTSSIPFSSVFTSSLPAAAMLILVYVSIAIIVFSRESDAFKVCTGCIIATAFAAVYLVFNYLDYSSEDSVFSALDVKQGMCICASSGNQTLMIDCGSSSFNENPGVTAYDYLKERNIGKLNALILTHLHSDHVNGVISLMELAEVESIFIPDYRSLDNAEFDYITQYARNKGISVYVVNTVCKFDLGEIEVELFPSDMSKEDYNETCMSALVSYNEFNMLVTGDSPGERELELIQFNELSDVNAIVAGHHGSNSSTYDEFLDYTSPDYALISTGKENRYGHPSKAVLERLYSHDVEVFRTDLNGTISLIYNN